MASQFNPAAAFWNVAARATDRAGDLAGVAETMREADVGQTPSEVVYAENKLRLLKYEPDGGPDYREPIVVVYALINRPYILDLQPDRSVIRQLTDAGFAVYLVDWGEPSRLDASLALEDYVGRYIDNCVDVARERAGTDDVHLLGYCMGGTMSAMYAALNPEKVRTLAMMAASLYFDDTGGVLEEWGSEDHFDPGTLAETFGTVPATFFDAGFQSMDPVQNTASKYARLADNADDDEFVRNFARMERWLDDGIDMAGETYRQYLERIYQGNEFARDELELGGEHVPLSNLRMPVLQIVAEYDHLVPPTASKPFFERIPSEDTELMEAAAGHIGLSVSRAAHDDLWPAVCDWFADRSTENGADLERVNGIGEAYANRLRDADVPDLDALAVADADALAERTGIPADRIENWISQAAGLAD